jgi:outer membrane immunogenic protein
MKRVAFAFVAFVGFASQAVASDLPRPPEQMLPARAPGVVLPFNWSGLHAGLNLGGGFGDAEGFEIGGQVGYNWQINQIVFGAETDLQWASMSKTSTVTGANLPAKQELDWFGTFRGRIGYAFWDRVLPYATAGLAYGSRKVTGGFAGFSSSDTSIGWAAGVGLEYAFDPFWSARIEYLHISLDGFTPSAAVGGRVTVGRLDNDIIRGGFNYKLMP